MPLPINIDELILGNIVESDRIEYKKGWNPEKVLRSICAFANDFNNIGGGYIIVGIEEDNGLVKLPPQGIQVNKIDTIQKELLEICHNIIPNYFPLVSVELFKEKQLLVIWTPAGDMRPYKAPKILEKNSEKFYYIRRMTSSVQAKSADITRLFELAAKTPYDNRVNQNYSIDDLNLTTITTFLKEVNSSLYDEITKLPFYDLCLKMNIARGPKENVKPLNVGLLLFSDAPHLIFRGAKIELVVYEDDIGDKFQEHVFTGPIYMQLRNALSFIKNNVVKEYIQKIDGVAESIRFYNYPFEALEEAIANAVYHKSYEGENPIEINVRHDCIEILSFPGPLPPVNNMMLKKDRIIARDYRNSRLGDFLKELHLTEGRGTGIPTIRAYMERNGSPEPVFETDQDSTYFLTILRKHDRFIGNFGNGVTSSTIDLTTEQIIILRKCIMESSLIDLMSEVGRTDRTKFRKAVINPLLEKGLLEMTLPHKKTSKLQKYKLSKYGRTVLNF